MARYPIVSPAADPPDRPFWSVMIPVYNCSDYLRLALRSVLAQISTEDRIQIEVIDDCSTIGDAPAVIAEFDDPRVSYFRHPQNVGPQANFTTCVQRSKGHWVHILHGDDMVAPGFYETFEAVARNHPDIGAAFCRVLNVDGNGAWIDISNLELANPGVHGSLIQTLAVKNIIMFPSMVVKRTTYERTGGFHPDLFHSADWDMWKRVALSTDVWYEPTPLAMYRIHPQSDTSNLMQTGANIADARNAIDIARRYLPEMHSAEWSRQALLYHGLYAVELAQQMTDRRSWKAARAQVAQAFRCSMSARVFFATAHLALHVLERRVTS